MSRIKDDEYSLSEEIIIERPPIEVYMALHQLQFWSKHLPHVKKVEIIYDDNKYQEFRMHIASTDGELLSVRSIRKCDEASMKIEFFQPEPPSYLKHHSGGWIFQEHDKFCRVITFHTWDLNQEITQVNYQKNESTSYEQRIMGTLREHAKLALFTWKSVLEGSN